MTPLDRERAPGYPVNAGNQGWFLQTERDWRIGPFKKLKVRGKSSFGHPQLRTCPLVSQCTLEIRSDQWKRKGEETLIPSDRERAPGCPVRAGNLGWSRRKTEVNINPEVVPNPR